MKRMSWMQRKIQYPFVCSFCSKHQEQVKRLIAGPGGVYICDECAIAFSEGGGERLEQRNAQCSFCGKSRDKTRFLVTDAQKVHVCNECVTLCLEIFEEEQLPG